MGIMEQMTSSYAINFSDCLIEKYIPIESYSTEKDPPVHADHQVSTYPILFVSSQCLGNLNAHTDDT